MKLRISAKVKIAFNEGPFDVGEKVLIKDKKHPNFGAMCEVLVADDNYYDLKDLKTGETIKDVNVEKLKPS